MAHNAAAHVDALSDLDDVGLFRLHGPWLWIVEEGRLDVYLTSVEGRRVNERMRHLFRVTKGQHLFGFCRDDALNGQTLVASGTNDTRVRRWDRTAMGGVHQRFRPHGDGANARSPLDTHDGSSTTQRPSLDAVLHTWVHTLARAVRRKDSAPNRVDVAPHERETIPEDTAVRAEEGLVWVRHVEGASQLNVEHDASPLDPSDPFVPVSSRVGIRTHEESTLVMRSTHDLAEHDRLWDALDAFQERMVGQLLREDEQQQRQEQHHLDAQADHRQSIVEDAFHRLATVFEPKQRADHVRTDAGPLYAACRAVGQHMNVDVKVPEGEAKETSRLSELDQIARASGVQVRKVALRGRWWAEDTGPIVGRLEESGRPVALLPQSPGEYEMYDPEEETRTPVTREVAQTLHPFAHIFYRPLPNRKLGFTDVLSFGFEPCWRDLWIVLLVGAGGGLLSMATPVVTGQIVDTVIPSADRGQLLQLTLALIVCAVVSGLFRLTRGIALLRIQGRMQTETQAAVWDRLLRLPISFFREYSAGELAKRTMGIGQIQQVLSGPTLDAMLGTIFASFNFVLLFVYSAELALWAALLCAIAAVVVGIGNYVQLQYQREITRLSNEISGTLLQLLDGISKLRVAGAEAQAFSIWAGDFSQKRELQFQKRRIRNGLITFQKVFPLVAILVIFAVAAPLILGPEPLSTGSFVAFLAALTAFLGPLLSMNSTLSQAFRVIPLYENAQPILETLPEVRAGTADPGRVSGTIELQHVRFGYSDEEPPVLEDLSLRINEGEMIAFVGPSGSGKSTLMKLLLGFERPDAGSIYYDQQEMWGLDVQALRSQIGVVLQDGDLMPGDIFTNIVGSAQLSRDRAWDAARMAGIADEIKDMPMGMNTMVSQGTTTLSGGQRQRLMIARAIVHRPRILFFDEATSDLDNETQATINRSLERLDATRLVIAHRLSTVKNADRICVLNDGRVVEQGTYDALLERNGAFAQLAERQLA